jgi:alginate production protein
MARNILLIFFSLMFLFTERIWGEGITSLETIAEGEGVGSVQIELTSPREMIEAKSSKSHKIKKKHKDVAFDVDAPPKTRIELTPELSFGARIGLEYQLEKNFNMETRVRDDLYIKTPEMSFAFLYTPTEKFYTFLNVEFSRSIVNDERMRTEEKRKKKDETDMELKQVFFSYTIMDGLNLKVGRQRIKDKREWVYDEKLDAIRLTYEFSKFKFDFSASEKKDKDLHDNHGSDERFNNFVLYGRYAPNKDTEIAAYGFVRDGRSKKRKENPIFYGLQVNGELIDDLDYWLNFAHVRGRDGSNKLRGFGFDSGFTYEFDDVPLKPSIVLGYAFGSGDDNTSDNIDRSFRQTGLQDNNAKLNGVSKIKYYGEMFDPELSNLVIATGGIGIRPMRKTSIELIYHYYRQHKRSDEIFDAEIDEDPDGLNKILGQEIDLVAAYKYKSKKINIKTSMVLGYFMPGQAFPREVDNALFAEFKIQFDF